MYGYPLQTNSTEDERNASCSILITLVPPESMDERNLRSTFPRTLPMNVYSCTAPHRTAPPLRRLQLLSARDCPERSRRALWAVLPSAACAGCRQDPLVFQALRHCCQGHAQKPRRCSCQLQAPSGGPLPPLRLLHKARAHHPLTTRARDTAGLPELHAEPTAYLSTIAALQPIPLKASHCACT